MLTVIHSIGLKVRQVEPLGQWLFGVVADESLPPSPRAPWIDARKAFRKHIKNNNLPTAVPAFFLPSASQSGPVLKLDPAALLRDFLLVDRDDDLGRARNFLQNYGLFAVKDLSRKKMPPAIKQRWAAAQKDGMTPFALPIKDFREISQEIRTLSDLMDALQRDDEVRAVKLSRDLGEEFIQDYEYSRRSIDNAFSEGKFLLAGVISSRLETARVAPVEDQGKVVPAIVTTGAKDALYAELMFRITEGTPLRMCKRQKCPKSFVPERPDKEYCSEECQRLNKRYRQWYRQSGKSDEEITRMIERASTSLREE